MTRVATSPITQLSRFSQMRHVSVAALKPLDTFERRHNSITPEEETEMAKVCGFKSMDELIDATVPSNIRREPMKLNGKYDEGMSESQFLR
jgi:glycine dehydrogenase